MPGLNIIKETLETARSQFVFSGYALALKYADRTDFLNGGIESYWGNAIQIQEDTWFDFGSLTKVICTTSLLALSVQEGRCDLEKSLSSYLSELKKDKLGTIPLRKFLSHSSGLEAWLPYHLESSVRTPLSYLAGLDEARLLPNEGKTVYSDVGFWILSAVLEKVYGIPLKELFSQKVCAPLGIHEMQFGPISGLPVAATEYCLTRNRLLHGEIFDENAAAMANPSGHAGLFGTARAILKWAEEWLRSLHGESQWLDQKVAARFVSRSGSDSSWGLGWDTKSPTGSSAGTLFSGQSFGHLGYPGCSVWIDPIRKAIAVLLSNRVHPSRLDERIRRVRPDLHDKIVRYWTDCVDDINKVKS